MVQRKRHTANSQTTGQSMAAQDINMTSTMLRTAALPDVMQMPRVAITPGTARSAAAAATIGAPGGDAQRCSRSA